MRSLCCLLLNISSDSPSFREGVSITINALSFLMRWCMILLTRTNSALTSSVLLNAFLQWQTSALSSVTLSWLSCDQCSQKHAMYKRDVETTGLHVFILKPAIEKHANAPQVASVHCHVEAQAFVAYQDQHDQLLQCTDKFCMRGAHFIKRPKSTACQAPCRRADLPKMMLTML